MFNHYNLGRDFEGHLKRSNLDDSYDRPLRGVEIRDLKQEHQFSCSTKREKKQKKLS